MFQRFAAILFILSILNSCSNNMSTTHYEPGTFGYDLQFLQNHDTVIVLQNGEARVVVSPKYQAKVFTSSAAGDTGPSFGWIHYKAFEGPQDPHMNAYGGEKTHLLWSGKGENFLFFSPPQKKEIP